MPFNQQLLRYTSANRRQSGKFTHKYRFLLNFLQLKGMKLVKYTYPSIRYRASSFGEIVAKSLWLLDLFLGENTSSKPRLG